jgi:hypothetical protein
MSNLFGREAIKATSIGVVAVPVRMTFGASGAVSDYDSFGSAVTPTIVAATDGRYLFTFAEKYHDCLGYTQGHDYQGTATDGQWQTFTGYVASTGTITLSHVVAGSEADPASGNIVDLIFFMLRSDLE